MGILTLVWLPFISRSFRRRKSGVAGYIATGWIETVHGQIIEGVFDGRQSKPAPGLTFTARHPQRDVYRFKWPDVNWVQVIPKPDPSEFVGIHAEILSKAPSLKAVVGMCSWPMPGGITFVLLPDASAEDWISRFRQSGVEVREG